MLHGFPYAMYAIVGFGPEIDYGFAEGMASFYHVMVWVVEVLADSILHFLHFRDSDRGLFVEGNGDGTGTSENNLLEGPHPRDPVASPNVHAHFEYVVGLLPLK